MSLKPMLIAPFTTGLDTDAEPWLAPPDSFTTGSNVHVHFGYLEKRGGYRLFATLSNGSRVMGILRYLKSDGTQANLAFDQSNAYLYNTVSSSYDILDSPNTIFNGDAYSYVLGANWESSNVTNRLYFTNGNQWNGTTGAGSRDGIRYFDNATPTVTYEFNPSTGGGNVLYGGKLIFVLGQRLIVLSTFEKAGVSATAPKPQRARWCAKQNPGNWDDTVAGGGDFADAGTGDQIVSAQTLQNQIIVFFTNSVWALIPTADPNKAFRWIRLNNYRACDSRTGSVAYDRYCIAMGVRGVTATDGTETQRIDQRISDFTINSINSLQFKKVFCARNYETLRWWTLYPGVGSDENNAALIYDDQSKAFTSYDISLNCLGYAQVQFDYGLNDFTLANNLDYTLEQMGEDTLQDYYWNEGDSIFLGGDLTGNIYQLNIGTQDLTEDVDAEIFFAGWNPYQSEGREAQMSYVDLYVDTDTETTGSVEFYVNDQESPYVEQEITFFPNLDFVAEVQNISKANPCNVNAAQHGLTTGTTVFIYGAKGMSQINSGNGYEITVVDEDNFTLDGVDSTAYGTYTGGANVYLKEFYQTKTWVRAYGGAIGYLHRIKLNITGGSSPFKIHALKPYFRPRGKRTIN